jgi:hypothetical protein
MPYSRKEKVPVCMYCHSKWEKGSLFHLSVFSDRVTSPDNPNYVLEGVHRRQSVLCSECWFGLMENIVRYMMEIRL